MRRPVSLKTELVAPLKALVLMRLRLMAINCSDRTPIHLSCWLRRQLGVCQFLPGRVCTRSLIEISCSLSRESAHGQLRSHGRGDPQTPKYLSVSLQLVTIKILSLHYGAIAQDVAPMNKAAGGNAAFISRVDLQVNTSFNIYEKALFQKRCKNG